MGNSADCRRERPFCIKKDAAFNERFNHSLSDSRQFLGDGCGGRPAGRGQVARRPDSPVAQPGLRATCLAPAPTRLRDRPCTKRARLVPDLVRIVNPLVVAEGGGRRLARAGRRRTRRCCRADRQTRRSWRSPLDLMVNDKPKGVTSGTRKSEVQIPPAPPPSKAVPGSRSGFFLRRSTLWINNAGAGHFSADRLSRTCGPTPRRLRMDARRLCTAAACCLADRRARRGERKVALPARNR